MERSAFFGWGPFRSDKNESHFLRLRRQLAEEVLLEGVGGESVEVEEERHGFISAVRSRDVQDVLPRQPAGVYRAVRGARLVRSCGIAGAVLDRPSRCGWAGSCPEKGCSQGRQEQGHHGPPCYRNVSVSLHGFPSTSLAANQYTSPMGHVVLGRLLDEHERRGMLAGMVLN